MSLISSLVGSGTSRPTDDTDLAAAALTVADVTSIHLQPHTVRAVVAESLRAHGGPDGVRTELERRLAMAPEHTTRTLDWARRTLASVHLGVAV